LLRPVRRIRRRAHVRRARRRSRDRSGRGGAIHGGRPGPPRLDPVRRRARLRALARAKGGSGGGGIVRTLRKLASRIPAVLLFALLLGSLPQTAESCTSCQRIECPGSPGCVGGYGIVTPDYIDLLPGTSFTVPTTVTGNLD